MNLQLSNLNNFNTIKTKKKKNALNKKISVLILWHASQTLMIGQKRIDLL